jgi:hypothetical protein
VLVHQSLDIDLEIRGPNDIQRLALQSAPECRKFEIRTSLCSVLCQHTALPRFHGRDGLSGRPVERLCMVTRNHPQMKVTANCGESGVSVRDAAGINRSILCRHSDEYNSMCVSTTE